MSHHATLSHQCRQDTDDGASTVVQSPTDVEKDHGQITNFKPYASPSTHDFPDGGLRAWLIACGVCTYPIVSFVWRSELEPPFVGYV
jgi:hypothetical protein